MRFLFPALGAVLLGACAGGPHLRDLRPSPEAVELTSTPFFPQDEYQCGPAALATALGASGVAATPGELVPKVYVPDRRGSLQPEMIATARAYGRVPYPINDSSNLLSEVAAGNPVLVLQNLGLGFWPAWHYAVVVGYDTGEDVVVLRSGTERRLATPTARFEQSWRLADRWGLVLAPPHEPPATARPAPWLSAASAFEELGQPAIAETAYLAATQRWPGESLAWQLLGNARHAQGNLAGAEAAYRAALEREDSAAARNNLAHVLMERGCPEQATTEIEAALATAAGQDASVLRRTRAQIEAWHGEPARDCTANSSFRPQAGLR